MKLHNLNRFCLKKNTTKDHGYYQTLDNMILVIYMSEDVRISTSLEMIVLCIKKGMIHMTFGWLLNDILLLKIHRQSKEIINQSYVLP